MIAVIPATVVGEKLSIDVKTLHDLWGGVTCGRASCHLLRIPTTLPSKYTEHALQQSKAEVCYVWY